MVKGLFDNIMADIIGAIVLGIMGITFIFVLATFGEVTGQNEITNQAIAAIMIILAGVGIPAGLIWLIKFLGEYSNGI